MYSKKLLLFVLAAGMFAACSKVEELEMSKTEYESRDFSNMKSFNTKKDLDGI